jgi:hypothetical protein
LVCAQLLDALNPAFMLCLAGHEIAGGTLDTSQVDRNAPAGRKAMIEQTANQIHRNVWIDAA